MKTKITIVAVLTLACGAVMYTRTHTALPSDLRDAVSDSAYDALKDKSGTETSTVKMPEPDIKPFYVETGSRRAPGNKGHLAGNTSSPAFPINWFRIDGGEFTMGSEDHPYDVADAQPAHKVSVKTFQISRTEVTVEQYAECVAAGACTAPGKHNSCNWGLKGREQHPVNCVTWDQAVQFAVFKGARLPTEAEWEYSATSGGRNQRYPWGDLEAGCERAVVWAYGKGYGCGRKSTFPVCSKPLGNTAQGLCDMAGNVGEWVQDTYQDSYNGAPADGGAFGSAGFRRVVRGGSFRHKEARELRADTRFSRDPRSDDSGIGFRIVK